MKKVEDLYASFITPFQKLEWIGEHLVDIAELIDDVSYEICKDNVERI